MTNNRSFSITNPKEICNNLTLLWKNNCLLSAHFGDQNESFITTIIKVDIKKNTLILDYGPKEYLNKKLLESQNVTFKAEYNGIKSVIPGLKITKTSQSGQTAFTLAIPKTMEWRERRQFYRVKSPLSNPAFCLINYGEEENQISIQLNLYDLSLSGMALVYEDLELSKELILNAQFENCKLTLPGVGEGIISFIIRNQEALNPDKPKKTQKIGCEFAGIKPAFESVLQRYMQTVEREHKKKS